MEREPESDRARANWLAPLLSWCASLQRSENALRRTSNR